MKLFVTFVSLIVSGQMALAAPTLAGSTFFGGAGDQVGNTITVDGGSAFVGGYPNGTVARYGLPMSSGASPMWSTSVGTILSVSSFAVSPTTVYATGVGIPPACGTSDGVGGTEGKTIRALLDKTTGALMNCLTTNYFPYRGSEGYYGAVWDGSIFYAVGSAETCGFGNNTFLLAPFDASGTSLGTAVEPGVTVGSGGCNGFSSMNGIVPMNGNVFLAGASNLVGEDGVVRPVLMNYAFLTRQWKARPTDVAGAFTSLTAHDGFLYPAGYSLTNGGDFLIEKYDAAGNRIWSKVSGGAGEDKLFGVVAVGNRIYAAGFTTSQGAGGQDIVILEIDPATGNTISTTLYGGAQDDNASGIASDGTDLYVIGTSASFASAAGNVVGQSDGVLLRYSIAAANLALAPVVTKSFNPPVVAPGGTSTLTISIQNPNTFMLSGVTLTDGFPNGITEALPNNFTLTGCYGGTASTLTLAKFEETAVIAAGATCAVSFNVVGLTPGALVNTTSTATSNDAPTGAAATATLNVLGAPAMSKSFAPSTIAIGGTSILTIRIANPNPVAMTGVAFTDTMPASLLITSPSGLSATGCGAGTVTAAAGTSTINLSNGTVQPGVECVITVVVQGLNPGGSVNLTSTVMGTVQGATLTGDPATATLQVGASLVSYLVRYAANLSVGDSVVNLTNVGTYSSLPGIPTAQNGNICANVYTYSPDEQLVSCCSCLVTPNALSSLSVINDLVSNTLTPIRPSAVVMKVTATAPSATGTCNPATVTRAGAANFLVPGLEAWGSTIHALPVGPGSPQGTFGVTETRFSKPTLSDAELTRMTQLCAFIQANGSGYGICKSCKVGGLGGLAR